MMTRAALFLAIVVCLTGIVGHDLWLPDEPRDAAIALHMSHSGDYLIPRLGGKPFVEKPPLAFSIAAASAHTLGPWIGNTGAIRLTSALWALGTLGMIFLLMRRMEGTDAAVLSTVLAATMLGFVENFHWFRVDLALCFFVMAAVRCFGEFYFGERRAMLVTAGLLTSGAFLSKGPVGPVFIGTAWLGMAIPWLVRRWRSPGKLQVEWIAHLGSLFAFLLPTALWMGLFRYYGGKALWDEWFWSNQTGRFSGTASQLGHQAPHEPLFYFWTALQYTLPWTPGVLIWWWGAGRDLWHRRGLSPARIFLLVWTVLAIVVLSVSVTKRDIYLAPLLPAFAMMLGEVFRDGMPKWVRIWLYSVLGLGGLALLAMAASPWLVFLVPESVPAEVRSVLGLFAFRNVFCAIAALAVAGLVGWGSRTHRMLRIMSAVAVMYIAFFAMFEKVLDPYIGVRARVQAFASKIDPEQRERIAGWGFQERTHGYFDYYLNWTVPQLRDERRLVAVLKGRDPQYDSVIIDQSLPCPALSKIAHRVRAETFLGRTRDKRGLVWVEGEKTNSP